MTNKTKMELEVEIAKLEKEIEDLKLANAMQPGEADALQRRVEELTADNERLNAEVANWKDENDKLINEAKIDGDMRVAMSGDLEKEKERADTAELAHANLVQEVDALRKQNNDLRVALETAKVRGSTLHGHIDDLKAPY